MHLACPRCTFLVQVNVGARSEVKYRALMDAHLSACRVAPTRTELREARREARFAEFLERAERQRRASA